MTVATDVRIRMGGCCPDFHEPLHAQMSSGKYDWPVSILELEDYDVWLSEHRTARKRAARAHRLGYRFDRIERANHEDAIYRINTSKEKRQGRPMTAAYQERQTFNPLPVYRCDRHRVDTYGILHGELVAYLVLYRSGDLLLVSQILGHADHLESDVMYLMMVEAFGGASLPATVFYNRWDSGTDGLRYFKSKLGFGPERVTWEI